MVGEQRSEGLGTGKKRLKTWCLLVLVNLFWAAQFPAYRVVSDAVSVSALNFWTFVLAIAVLLPKLLRERRLRPAPMRRSHWLITSAQFAWLALLGVIPPSVIMAWGIEHSSAANASILQLTIPVLMVLMGVWMLKERPGRYLFLGLGLALLCTALISWNDVAAGHFTGSTFLGNIAVFFAGAGAAFYNAYCKRLLDRHSPVEVLVYGYVAAIVLCAAISLSIDPIPFYQIAGWPLSSWIGIAVLGAVVWGGAMLLWMWLLNQLELVQVSASVYMLSVFGVILSAVTLGDHIGSLQIIAGTVVLASAYLSAAPPVEPLRT